MHPEQFALFLPVFFILIVAIILVCILRGRAASDFPYERIEKLFSPAERSFLGVLEQVLGSEYRIMGKVRLGDIIRPRTGLSASARTSALNRITSKHVDFALCNPATLQVIGVIELDDSSHGEGAQQRRDKFVDAALSSAGVPFVRIPAQRGYSPAEIRERVSVLFNHVA